MKKILVPTDFSECAKIASETAIEMAKKNDAEVLFLHYMSIPIDWIQLQNAHEKMYPDIHKGVRQATLQLDALVSMADKQKVKAKHHIAFNENAFNTDKDIETFGVDMVVMGSQGATGLKEFFLGSNAQRTIRQATVPVLVVKDRIEATETPHIVFVSDFDPDLLTGFAKITEFANLMGAAIQLLYVNTPDEFQDSWTIKAKMEKFRNSVKIVEVESYVVDAFDFEEGLYRFIQGDKGSIVAMVTHHTGVFNRDTKAEKIANHLETPFFNVKD